MKFISLIKLFRRLLIRQANVEFNQKNISLDGCIDNVTIDMIKALYAAYHGLESDLITEWTQNDLLTEWACNVLSQIQKGLREA